MKYFIASLFVLVLPLTQACASQQQSQEQRFEQWKEQLVIKASKQGLPKDFVKQQLAPVKFDPKIIERDRNQVTSDTKVDYQEWIQRWLSSDPARVERGMELLSQHKELLERVEQKYQVDKEVIVALWGVETLYGRITGNHSIIHSLSTLAFDQRRSAFFETELIAALKIIHQGHIKPEQFLGSWAGAMGQCQFMPTSFMRLAVDFDGDGKKDIWNNHADLFASMANYLQKMGWKKGRPIGVLVQSRDRNFDIETMRTKEQYHKLGVRKLDGSRLQGTWRRKMATIPHKNSPLILRGPNYHVIMRWNKSSLFAALNILLMEKFVEARLASRQMIPDFEG